MSKFFKIIFRRSTILATLFILQFAIFILVGTYLFDYSTYINAAFYTMSIIMVLYILTLRSGAIDIKLPWIVLILVFPVFGTFAYSLFNQEKLRKKIIKNIESQVWKAEDFASSDPIINDILLHENKRMFQQANYMYTSSDLPPFTNSPTKYFKIGEEYFKELLKQLKAAKKYIFIESFIINEGKMWNSILDILNEKIKEDIEVRVIYDDWGNITKLPDHYNKKLEKLGIKCVVFNPITPILSLRHNTRDHKKIIIVDGKFAFTGGVNLADEYINEKLRFGHWKDSGIMIQGDAVKSFTFMFLETWHCYKDKNEECKKYISNERTNSDGFVQPYIDSPADTELVARNVYINILNDATDYVYITTPYLILDPELTNSIVAASKRGVDVKIITPHIPDKWYVHLITQSHYLPLTKAGVEIYEYKPGFIHAKNVICDDIVATVGTVNFDYRSMYHNYECGVWMYKTSTIQEMKKDFEETLKKSLKIEQNKIEKTNIIKVMLSSILKFFSPLF